MAVPGVGQALAPRHMAGEHVLRDPPPSPLSSDMQMSSVRDLLLRRSGDAMGGDAITVLAVLLLV